MLSGDRRWPAGIRWGTRTGAPKTERSSPRRKRPDGGWLVLDKGYQDVKFYTEFRCAGELRCRRSAASGKDVRGRLEGSLRLAFRRRRFLRPDAERGRKGVEPDALCREPPRSSRAWPRAPGQTERLRCRASRAPPSRWRNSRKKRRSRPPPPPRTGGAGRGGAGPPRPELKAGEWNTLDVIVDTDMVWTTAQRTPRRQLGDQRPHDGLRTDCASCRGNGRGPVPRCRDQGPEPQDGTGGASLVPLPHAAAQRFLLLVGRHRRRYQSRRHSGRDRRAVLLPRAGLHRAPRVHRRPQLQRQQQLSRRHGLLRLRLHRRRMAGHHLRRFPADLPVCESQRRIAPLGPLQRGAERHFRDRSVPRYRWRRQARDSVCRSRTR